MKKDEKKAIIILPTYNGEKYLSELLDSIYNQTYPLIEIITRDDGSTDNTTKIIKEYSKKNIKGRKITIIENGGKTLKCPDCFIKLLEIANDGDYYFFCDQDDYWMSDKISQAISKLKKVSDKPALHFGAYEFCDENLKYITNSPKVPQDVGLRNVIYDYWPLGFNISFNKRLYDFVFNNKPEHIYYHDCWFAQVALGVGTFIYSDNPSVKYRRQKNAVTYSNHNKFSLIIWRIKRFFFNNDNLINLKKILNEYNILFNKYLSDEDKKMLNIFTNDSFKNYFKRVFFPHRLRLKITDEIGLRILFIIGKL